MGIVRDELLRAAQLDEKWLEAPAGHVRRSEVSRLIEAALDLTGEETVALEWGAGLRDQSMSVVSNLVKHAPTLRTAFEVLSRFSKLLADEAGTRLIEQGDTVTVLVLKPAQASFRVQRAIVEVTLAGIHRLIRYYSPTGHIERVSFDYAAPSYHAAYTRVFESVECFDQPFTGIQFDRALMSAPSPYKDEDLHCALQALAERRLRHVTDTTPYWARARDVLIGQSAPHRVSMAFVARRLDVSVRSLRRRLSEEGKSYREIANEACQVVATRLIGDERRTIQETAYAMGFSDTSAFHRAFKRWTGETPTGFRAHC